jgi:hypothetical protein
MSFPRWLGLSFVAAIAAAFGACSSGSDGTGGDTTTVVGGSGGSGGSGSTTTIITTTTTPTPEAGPIECKGLSTNVPKGDCDALQQDCPLGQSCRPAFVDGGYLTSCAVSTGLKTAGETCNSISECTDGLFCVLDKCTPVCCRDDNEPCAGGICNVSAKYGTYNMYFCHYAPTCDLLTPNACATGLQCHIEDVSQGLATCGEPSGANAPNLGSCNFINDCGDMQQCQGATTNNPGVCRYYCWLDSAPGTPAGLGGCPDDQTCKNKVGTSTLNFGVPGLGLCFANNPNADAGTDGGDAGDAGGSGGSGMGGSGAGGSGSGTGGVGPGGSKGSGGTTGGAGAGGS